MKHSAEHNAFTNAVERIMAVPKTEILRRQGVRALEMSSSG
jgi:hypothetical protein